jgi:hypothetical protein
MLRRLLTSEIVKIPVIVEAAHAQPMANFVGGDN